MTQIFIPRSPPRRRREERRGGRDGGGVVSIQRRRVSIGGGRRRVSESRRGVATIGVEEGVNVPLGVVVRRRVAGGRNEVAPRASKRVVSGN